jgi:hypothetical protein
MRLYRFNPVAETLRLGGGSFGQYRGMEQCE